jgi:hypothetical protein
MKIWSWQQAILQSELQSTTKLVLLALSTYMNAHGDNCFPSHTTIAKDASLSTRAVITHIQLAVDAGFLVKEKRNLVGAKWDSNEYHASLPSENKPILTPDVGVNDIHSIEQNEPRSLENRGVNVIHPSAEILDVDKKRGEPNSLEGCTTFTRGVNDVHTNYPLNYPINSPEKNISKNFKEKNYPEGFEVFWQNWPDDRRCEKPKAFRAYQKAITKIHHAQLMEAVGRYLQTAEAKTGFAPYPAKWLNQDRWLEVMSRDAPLSTPALTLHDIGGDTQQNKEFLDILEKIRMRLGDATFRSWFKSLRVDNKNCTVLKLSVDMNFVRMRLDKDFREVLHTAITSTWPEINTVQIVARDKS